MVIFFSIFLASNLPFESCPKRHSSALNPWIVKIRSPGNRRTTTSRVWSKAANCLKSSKAISTIATYLCIASYFGDTVSNSITWWSCYSLISLARWTVHSWSCIPCVRQELQRLREIWEDFRQMLGLMWKKPTERLFIWSKVILKLIFSHFFIKNLSFNLF